MTGRRGRRSLMRKPRRAARVAVALLAIALGACSATSQREAPAVDIAAARRAGEAAYAAGDWRGAEPHYRELVAAIPQDAELWFRLGNIYARTEQPDRAVRAYREALVRDGDLAKAWFNMGIVHLREAANSFMKMQVHVSPDDLMARQGSEAYDAVMAILGQQSAAPEAAGTDGPISSAPALPVALPAADGPVTAGDDAMPPSTVAGDDAAGADTPAVTAPEAGDAP